MNLYLTFEENRVGGEICSGQEDESYPSYEDVFIIWTPLELTTNKPSGRDVETITVDNILNEHYLVVVRYSTGNTFGRTNGAWSIEELSPSLERANQIKQYIEATDLKYNNRHIKRKLQSPDEYRPSMIWSGYFEQLESVDIFKMVVNPSIACKKL